MGSGAHVVCQNCDTVNRVASGRPAEAAKCGRCGAGLFPEGPFALTGERLQKHIARSDLPLIVDFWAAWCGPCRAMAPVFERAAEELRFKARFVKVDIDPEPELAQALNIQGIPALLAFRNGREAGRRTGLTDLGSLRSWADQLTG